MYVPAPGHRHPAMLAACCLASGIVIADALDSSPLIWLSATLALAIASSVMRMLPRSVCRWVSSVGLLLLLVSVGAWRLAEDNRNRPSARLVQISESNRKVEVLGRLSSIPLKRADGWRAEFEIQAVADDSLSPLTASCQLYTREDLGHFDYGDRLRFATRIRLPHVRRNPGGFDYANHLFRRGIDAIVRPVGNIHRVRESPRISSVSRFIEPVRDLMREVYSDYLSPVSGALILGFLLGDTDQLDPVVYRAFRESGTLHLLAVSGANVWLVLGMVLLPLRLLRVARIPRTMILFAVIVLFCSLTRNEPSVVRASLTAATLLIGQLGQRSVSPLNSVGLAGLIILLISPNHLFRPGFQLSFAAVIGIIVAMRQSSRFLRSRKSPWMRWTLSLVVSSTAAALVTAPIIAWHFGSVPLITPVSNLLMIPIASLALYGGIALLFLHVVVPALAGVLAVPTDWILLACAGVAKVMARVPGTQFQWPHPSGVVVFHLYFVLVLISSWNFRYQWVKPVTCYAVGLLFLSAVSGFGTAPKAAAGITVLDAGSHLVVAREHFEERSIAWVLDSSAANDEDLGYWVLESFARVRTADILTDEGAPPDSVSEAAAPTHRTIQPVSTSPGWRFEEFSFHGDTVSLLRLPTQRSSDAVGSTIPAGRGEVLILPARCPSVHIRQFLDGPHPPAAVIFYGRSLSHVKPDQWLAAWRARYPDLRMWSTEVHGGVGIRWSDSGLAIAPTIAADSWRDPDFR